MVKGRNLLRPFSLQPFANAYPFGIACYIQYVTGHEPEELQLWLSKRLPITDCRFGPDGDWVRWSDSVTAQRAPTLRILDLKTLVMVPLSDLISFSAAAVPPLAARRTPLRSCSADPSSYSTIAVYPFPGGVNWACLPGGDDEVPE